MSAPTVARTGRVPSRGLMLALLAATMPALAEVAPLPRDQWPGTVAAAVPLIVRTLTPSQRSIVVGTSRDTLPMLQPEWGEDIETLLGLNAGNQPLVRDACQRPCAVDEATLRLMEAAWDALRP